MTHARPPSGVVLAVLGVVAIGCSGAPEGNEPTRADAAIDCSSTAEADFPDVVDVAVEPVGDGFRVSTTLCSAYDTPERYADAWRVMTPDGQVLGVRELLHDHAGEQPFTRTLSEPIEVPEDVDTLVVEGRDQLNGWGGRTHDAPLPGR